MKNFHPTGSDTPASACSPYEEAGHIPTTRLCRSPGDRGFEGVGRRSHIRVGRPGLGAGVAHLVHGLGLAALLIEGERGFTGVGVGDHCLGVGLRSRLVGIRRARPTVAAIRNGQLADLSVVVVADGPGGTGGISDGREPATLGVVKPEFLAGPVDQTHQIAVLPLLDGGALTGGIGDLGQLGVELAAVPVEGAHPILGVDDRSQMPLGVITQPVGVAVAIGLGVPPALGVEGPHLILVLTPGKGQRVVTIVQLGQVGVQPGRGSERPVLLIDVESLAVPRGALEDDGVGEDVQPHVATVGLGPPVIGGGGVVEGGQRQVQAGPAHGQIPVLNDEVAVVGVDRHLQPVTDLVTLQRIPRLDPPG